MSYSDILCIYCESRFITATRDKPENMFVVVRKIFLLYTEQMNDGGIDRKEKERVVGTREISFLLQEPSLL